MDIFSAAANSKTPWKTRIAKAFWRGRDSSTERLELVKFSRKNPDIVEAGLTRMFFFRDRLAEFEPLVEQISFFEFFKVTFFSFDLIKSH